jgi:hypothetical protein
MAELDPVLVFVRPLNRLNVRYMVTGSVASIVYGQPRLTHDVDVVIELTRPQIGLLGPAFPPDAFYCPPPEIIRLENERSLRGHFNIIHHETGFKADLYPTGSDPFHEWGLARRRQITIGEDPVQFAPPEYVIVRKLEYYQEGGSDKHVLDIRAMLETSVGLIDRAELDRQIAARHLQEVWQSVVQGS